MANDTSSAGYLTPTGAQPTYDDTLLDSLQPVIVGITGLPDNMVRPRLQIDDQPNEPGVDTDWCAFGIREFRQSGFPYEGHVDDSAGYDIVEDYEEFDLLMSFYGPNSRALAQRTRIGLTVAQNRAPLQALGIDVGSLGSTVQLPALLHGKWQRRVDFAVALRRNPQRTYGVLTVVEPPPPAVRVEPMGLNNEIYVTPLYVEP